ncbi:hypothetical protein ACHAPM_001525 [Fusarium culmorum]
MKRVSNLGCALSADWGADIWGAAPVSTWRDNNAADTWVMEPTMALLVVLEKLTTGSIRDEIIRAYSLDDSSRLDDPLGIEDPLGWWPWDLNDPETWMGEFDPHYDSYSVSISTPQYEESTGYYVEASTQTENAINNVDSSYQPEGNSDENPWYAEDAAPMDLDNDIWW